MTDSSDTRCRMIVWAVAAAAGLAAGASLVLVARTGLGPGAGAGALLALFLGLFLRWAFCTGPAREVAVGTPVTARPRRDSAAAHPPSEPAPNTPLPLHPAPGAAPSAGSVPRVSRPHADLVVALAKSHDLPPASVAVPLAGPRGGRPDDLKRIRGVGPKLERLLNEAGIWHFDQIASWRARDIAAIDERIGAFRGRITRDAWVRQARALAAEAGDKGRSPSDAATHARDATAGRLDPGRAGGET
jgi:NADH-quinone oxidoreductase subunit E